MDPEACLQRCEAYVKLRWKLTDAVEALVDYYDWRHNGGFEPENGDARACRCAIAIVSEIIRRVR